MMRQFLKYLLLFACAICAAFAFVFTISAQNSGAGEVTGTVYESWTKDNRTVFRMNIATQKSESGFRLDTPNIFVYAGEGRDRITDGDVLKLQYDTSDADGVIAQNVEFIEDRQGSIGQTKNLSIIITLFGFLFGVLLLVGAILYQKRRMRQAREH
jgi:hypothetical protein